MKSFKVERPPIVFVNRVYPPVGGATGQLLAELAGELVRRGWNVTVVTGRRDDAKPGTEWVNGVRVERVRALRYTRASLWRRGLSYLSLYPAMFMRLVRLRPLGIVVIMTDPPLSLALGPALKVFRRIRLVHWAQDVYPEVAECLGVLAPQGRITRFLRWISTRSLKQCDQIIAVGRCMKARLQERGVAESLIRVIPNWTDVNRFSGESSPDNNAFRREFELEDRFVVMYSGNLGMAHPFRPILEAARILQLDAPQICFVFVGSGARLGEVKETVSRFRLENVRFAPFQPTERLADSLAAADLHLAAMFPKLSGLVVPSKVYGALAAGRPCVFIGPAESEIAHLLEGHQCGSVVTSFDGTELASAIKGWYYDTARITGARAAAVSLRPRIGIDAAVESFCDLFSRLSSLSGRRAEQAADLVQAPEAGLNH